MVVLAGAIILTLNNSGILTKAEEAVEGSNFAQVQQLAQLKWAEAYADGARTKEKLEEAVTKGLQGINTTAYNIEVTENGVTVELKKVSTDEEGFFLSGVWKFNDVLTELESGELAQDIEFYTIYGEYRISY